MPLNIRLYRKGSLESACIRIEENAYSELKQAFSTHPYATIVIKDTKDRHILRIKPNDYLPVIEIIEE